MGSSEKAGELASAGRIKLHVFVPSRRQVMTVVRGDEHWVDAERGYCSCPAFYFAATGDRKKTCYHLRSASLAIKTGMVEEIEFSDEEFDDFVRGLISEL